MSQALLASAGFVQYEVSAYAQAGRQCAHNLNYWRFGDYLGIGAGAHGKLSLPSEQRILRRWKKKHPADYLATAGTAAAIGGDEDIAESQRPFDFMLNALRLDEGFDLTLFAARTGLPASAAMPQLEAAARRGWMHAEGDHWRTTPLGARFLNDVMASFLPD